MVTSLSLDYSLTLVDTSVGATVKRCPGPMSSERTLEMAKVEYMKKVYRSH